MAKFSDSKTLQTSSHATIYIDLISGYGQPSSTSIHLKKGQGQEQELMSFVGNVEKAEIGSGKDLKWKKIDIRTTIHDVHDNPIEKVDISLNIRVYDDDSNQAETEFSMKTIGMGTIVYSDFLVTIIP